MREVSPVTSAPVNRYSSLETCWNGCLGAADDATLTDTGTILIPVLGLFYAGSDDSESFGRRGHGKIRVSRSRDLVTWRAAGDRAD